MGTRTTYSVTFWLPGPCGQRRRDGECGAAEAPAGNPPPTPPHTHEGRHGRRRSVVRVGSGPVLSASLSRGEAALAVPGLWPRPRTPRPRCQRSWEQLPGSRARSAGSATTPVTSAPAPNLEEKLGVRRDGNLLRVTYFPSTLSRGRSHDRPAAGGSAVYRPDPRSRLYIALLI